MRLRKYLRRIGLAVIILIGGVVLSAGSWEAYLYLTRSQAKARADAQAMFEEVCAREEINPLAFTGPERPYIQSDERLDTYSFEWTRKPAETITVQVTYLPYQVLYSISPELSEHEWAARSK